MATSRITVTMTSPPSAGCWTVDASLAEVPLLTRDPQVREFQVVQDAQVTVESRHQLPRSPGGKFKLVTADPTAQPVPLVHDTSGR
jgi:hypothetical protein